MRVLAVHPSGLMYTRVFLTLEPLGLELVAGAARADGHDVRIVDLQVERTNRLWKLIDQWRPDAVCLAGNYLANIPEIIDTAIAIKSRLPSCFVFVGGHSASFVANDMLAHAAGAIDCVIKGEGEVAVPLLLRAVGNHEDLTSVPGAISAAGEGPPPQFVDSLDTIRPARDLLTRRRRYFIGMLDPCASIEFARGCPWDCTFCSAWTFYGRSYRIAQPEVIAEDLPQIREPGVFIVDDVAFVHARHGFAIGEAIERRGIRKQFYLETRGDVLLRNKDVFQLLARPRPDNTCSSAWRRSTRRGCSTSASGSTLGPQFGSAGSSPASLGISVAINIIADPYWDRSSDSKQSGSGAWPLPEVVNLSVNDALSGHGDLADRSSAG